MVTVDIFLTIWIYLVKLYSVDPHTWGFPSHGGTPQSSSRHWTMMTGIETDWVTFLRIPRTNSNGFLSFSILTWPSLGISSTVMALYQL